MNRSDIDYIIEKLDSYKPDNIYDGCNSVKEKQDQRVSEVLDSLKIEFESDYENGHTPMPKELVLTCELDEEQMQRLKEQIESAKVIIEPVKSNWIKCSDRLPEDNTAVNVTWVNRNPVSYYTNIKNKPFTATAVYYHGCWYWWSVIVQDLLSEYGIAEGWEIDSNIDVIAWTPLPEPPEVK